MREAPRRVAALAAFLLLVISGARTPAQAPVEGGVPTAVTAGELVIEPATLINLGFEWFISGDGNRNATVSVGYRKAGDAEWRTALPLLRIGGERIYAESRVDVVLPPMFAGSVLDLQPDTAYEVRLLLSDPDGVSGEGRKVVTVRTRAEPMPAAGGRVLHVYPHDFKGAKTEPSFEGLMCAYNFWCAGTDWATSGRPRVQPGDTILVHAGTYKYNRYEYTNTAAVNRTEPLDGTYYLTAKGTADKPIAIKAAGDGEVIFDGSGNFAVFDVRAADYTYFEGLTIRNAEYGILAGTQFIAGAKGLTVKRSRFENVGSGVFTNFAGSSNFYIADNTFLGRNDPNHLIGWNGDALWSKFNGVEGQTYPPKMASYVAVKLYGPGHVVAFNFISDFHDGINVETYGNPDGSVATGPGIPAGPRYPPRDYFDRRPVAIDFYNNYISSSHDNPIEADGGMHNIRVLRNLFINHASHAFCNQPALGGPVYWIRNIAYNLPGGSTRLTNGSAGAVFYNNTILSETQAALASNVHWRNNLILGQNAAPAIFSVTTMTNYSSSDYNAFRPNAGVAASFQWNAPPPFAMADMTGPGHAAALQNHEYRTLAEYSKASGQDQHSLVVDYDIFENVRRLDARDAATVQRIYKAEGLDFRLKAGAAPIDRGVALPNVTDGFTGRAPDMGALEAGQPAPHYGPRP